MMMKAAELSTIIEGIPVPVTCSPLPPLIDSKNKPKVYIARWSQCGHGWSWWTMTIFHAVSLTIYTLVTVVTVKSNISHMCARKMFSDT